MSECYLIKDKSIIVKGISQYMNGVMTTAGFFEDDQLERIPEQDTCITYTSQFATELPYDFMDHLYLDDNSVKQYLKEIDFEVEHFAYIMADGTRSEGVTIL